MREVKFYCDFCKKEISHENLICYVRLESDKRSFNYDVCPKCLLEMVKETEKKAEGGANNEPNTKRD